MLTITAKLKPDSRRIDRLVEDLQYVNSQSFVRSLPLASFRERALNFLKKHFPVSKQGSSNQNEFGYHLVEGWKSKLVSSVTGVGFELYHMGEGNSRILTILNSLNTGSKAFSYTAKDDFVFWGKYRTLKGKLTKREGWISIVEGRTVNRSEREGVEFEQDTYDYITMTLLPEMREMVRDRVASRLDRIS